MPSFCAVSTCEQKYSHSENVSFHKFPLRNSKVLAEWIKFTNRGANWKPSRWNSICSRHFDKSDFREYLSRKCLKKDAIPTITMRSNISFETYHLSTVAGSPDEMQMAHSEQDDYSGQMTDDQGKMESSEMIEICRLCGDRADNLTCNPLRSLDEPEIESMFRKCLPAVNMNGYSDQSRIVCTDCVTQLKQYSEFIDKILTYQREFGANEHFDSFPVSEHSLVHGNATKFPIKPSTPNSSAALFIKQEPINVKQEKIDNTNRRSFSVQLPMTSPSLCLNPFADSKKIKGPSIQQDSNPPPKIENNNSTYCCTCDRIFGNCFEYRTHKCTKSEQNVERELGNNCEIMEIITINNPVSFIDLAEDENATQESRPMKTESFSEQERKERLEFEHAYAKRATSCNLKQEIIDSNMDSCESGYDGMEQTIENDAPRFDLNANTADAASHILFECSKCNQSFGSQELLDEHSTQMHNYPLKLRICTICNAKFESSMEYLIHKNRMHTQRYQCQQCRRKFNTATILKSHERLCSRESKDFCFSCRHCGKNIKNLAIMNNHLKSCTGKQLEPIDEWQQELEKSSNNIIRLKQFKEPTEPYVNSLGNSSDKMACDLTDTRASIRNDKMTDDSIIMQSFKFIVDDSKFIFLNENNAMPRNQTTECGMNTTALNGQFACDTCGRPFLSLQLLKQHIRDVHDSERKFSCSLCTKTFKGLSGLKQHISGYHYKIKPHLCPVCNYSYALKGDMQRCRHSKLRTTNNFKII